LFNGFSNFGRRTQKRKKVSNLIYLIIFIFLLVSKQKEKSKISVRRNGNKKHKYRKQTNNPFIDFEADESEKESGNSYFEDEEFAFDKEFIDNGSEMGEDEDLPPNPYMNSGFFERIEAPNSPPMDQPCSSKSLTDSQILEKAWRETEAKMEVEDIILPFGKEAIEEEEKKRKQDEEEEKKKKRMERRNKKEIVTYVYAHYGQKYDHVRITIKLHINF